LHLVLFSSEGKFDFDEYFTKNKAVILINNGIHAGEPDGDYNVWVELYHGKSDERCPDQCEFQHGQSLRSDSDRRYSSER
jgi:hypothetical protein